MNEKLDNEKIRERLAIGLQMLYPEIDEKDIMFSYCPYRVCPVGAHIDHQKGNVTGFALNYGINIAYVPTYNHLFEATSNNFEGSVVESVTNVGDKKGDWADYLRGTAKFLHEKYGANKGINCIIDGSLPIGGISSSAAVIIAFMKALCTVNGVHLTNDEAIGLVKEIENKYIGVNSGTLDQSCEILSKKDNLLSLDVSTGKYKLIKQSPDMSPYKIGIFFSGVKRTLVGSAYNTRVDELKGAGYALKAYAGMPYGKIDETVLRDVPEDVFRMYGDRLPDNFRKRAEHYYSEMNRVQKALKFWESGDIENFGKVVFESGDSSIINYEAGSPELIAIHEIMKETDGIYGGRFSGAGFKGCCLGIVNPDKEEEIKEEVTLKYLSKFPQYKDSFAIYYCDSADGVAFSKDGYAKVLRRGK